MNALVMTSPFWMAVIPSSIIHLVLNMSASCISSSHDFINVCKISTLSCVWDVKKEMCKVQEVSSGFWVTQYHLRIITKLEVTLKSPSTRDFMSLSWHSITDSGWGFLLYSASAFIPLNSLVSLSILFLSIHKDSLPECYNFLHEHFSHHLQHFAGVISRVLHQQCLASPSSCHLGKDTFEDCFLSVFFLKLHYFRAGRDSAWS